VIFLVSVLIKLFTGWLQHQRTILEAITQAAQNMRAGYTILCHCSDGWDRTTQVVAGVQLLLDPYYRTIEGFIILIEKEWRSFGHRFATRIGYLASSPSTETAPIFHQWIESVWQILRQYFTSFEFNEYFLIFILDQFHSGRFGTFLYDSEKERMENHVTERTPSLWDYIYLNKSQFINPFYKPVNHLLVFDPRASQLQFWENYYFRWGKHRLQEDWFQGLYESATHLLYKANQKIALLEQKLEKSQNDKQNLLDKIHTLEKDKEPIINDHPPKEKIVQNELKES